MKHVFIYILFLGGIIAVFLTYNHKINKLTKSNRELERSIEKMDNHIFQLHENQLIYLKYGDIRKMDDLLLKNENDSTIYLSSLLQKGGNLIVRITDKACLSCIQNFCTALKKMDNTLQQHVIYISDYESQKKAELMKSLLGIEHVLYRADSLNLSIENEKRFYVFTIDTEFRIGHLFLPMYNDNKLIDCYLECLGNKMFNI